MKKLLLTLSFVLSAVSFKNFCAEVENETNAELITIIERIHTTPLQEKQIILKTYQSILEPFYNSYNEVLKYIERSRKTNDSYDRSLYEQAALKSIENNSYLKTKHPVFVEPLISELIKHNTPFSNKAIKRLVTMSTVNDIYDRNVQVSEVTNDHKILKPKRYTLPLFTSAAYHGNLELCQELLKLNPLYIDTALDIVENKEYLKNPHLHKSIKTKKDLEKVKTHYNKLELLLKTKHKADKLQNKLKHQVTRPKFSDITIYSA